MKLKLRFVKQKPLHWQDQSGSSCRLEEQGVTTRQQVTDLNKQRKLQHLKAGEQLKALEGSWLAMVEKNREIANACEKLEAELAAHTAT